MFLKDLINIPGMEKLDEEFLFSEVFMERMSVLFKENNFFKLGIILFDCHQIVSVYLSALFLNF